MLAQALHIGDQMLGRIVGQIADRLRAAATALIENDDAVTLGIEEPAVHGLSARPRPAVQKHHRRAPAVARLLPIEPVTAADGQHAGFIGLEMGKEVAAGKGCVHASSASVFINVR